MAKCHKSPYKNGRAQKGQHSCLKATCTTINVKNIWYKHINSLFTSKGPSPSSIYWMPKAQKVPKWLEWPRQIRTKDPSRGLAYRKPAPIQKGVDSTTHTYLLKPFNGKAKRWGANGPSTRWTQNTYLKGKNPPTWHDPASLAGAIPVRQEWADVIVIRFKR